ncbi:MAG: hypothetical protein AAB436_03950 [Patescibacteria group bacterium]
MPVLETPRLTYSAAEGLRIGYDPTFDDLSMPQLVAEFFVCKAGIATAKNIEPIYAKEPLSNRMMQSVDTILAAKSYEPEAVQPRPFEAGVGGYGFRYKLSPAFKDGLRALFSSGDDIATSVASRCFEAMDKLNPHYRSSGEQLDVLRSGDSGYTFLSGPYNLKVKDGSIDNIHFGGDAGMNTALAGRTPSGDTIHHYNNDYDNQRLGLLLGIGSIAHSVYRHSLMADLAGLVTYRLDDLLVGPCPHTTAVE